MIPLDGEIAARVDPSCVEKNAEREMDLEVWIFCCKLRRERRGGREAFGGNQGRMAMNDMSGTFRRVHSGIKTNQVRGH